MVRGRFANVVVAALLLLTTGCGGSGSGPLSGSGGGTPLFDCTGATEFDWSVTSGSATYCSYGPGTVGADAAYAKGATGAGVVVAVIDTGIDTTHTELDANISVDSIDIVREVNSIGAGGAMTDEDGHGTHVSGIIAAEKNGVANHGIAYDASILAIRADTREACGASTCSVFYDVDLVNAINYAAANNADVINMSLGGSGAMSADFETALTDAMTAGAVIVAATGNEGAANPIYPAYYASDGIINASAQMIAVGAVDKTGAIASFSNDCGDAADFCLVAPGVNIVSTVPADSLSIGSGTSQASPLVAGAAALLIGTWPALTPAEVVDILLTTATDLGAAGVDTVYGHGLLNLDSAVAPLGSLVIPLSDSAFGDSVALDGTALTLGPAFGDALGHASLLGEAFALDDYDRDFAIGLEQYVVRTERGFGLLALMSTGSTEEFRTGLDQGISLALGYVNAGEMNNPSEWAGMAADTQAEPHLQGLQLGWEFDEASALRMGYGVTPEGHLGSIASGETARLFWMPADVLAPQHGLVGSGSGVAVTRSLDGGFAVTAGFLEEEDREAGASDARIGEISLVRRFAGGATLNAGFSAVNEDQGFLGGEAYGALGVEGANSSFYTISGVAPLGSGFEIVGNYTMGKTDMSADGTSLLGNWSDVRANAFGLGIVRRGVLGSDDRLGLLAGQPLRVNSAEATLTVPVGYSADKSVDQASETLSLVPTGRELDVQLAYERPLSGQTGISGWLMMQIEPGHVADAAPAYGIGLRYSAEF